MSKVYEVRVKTTSLYSVRIEADNAAEAQELVLSRRFAGYSFNHEVKDRVDFCGVVEGCKPTAIKPLEQPARLGGVVIVDTDEGEEIVPDVKMVEIEEVMDHLGGKESE